MSSGEVLHLVGKRVDNLEVVAQERPGHQHKAVLEPVNVGHRHAHGQKDAVGLDVSQVVAHQGGDRILVRPDRAPNRIGRPQGDNCMVDQRALVLERVLGDALELDHLPKRDALVVAVEEGQDPLKQRQVPGRQHVQPRRPDLQVVEEAVDLVAIRDIKLLRALVEGLDRCLQLTANLPGRAAGMDARGFAEAGAGALDPGIAAHAVLAAV